jgi:hypothetical protein
MKQTPKKSSRQPQQVQLPQSPSQGMVAKLAPEQWIQQLPKLALLDNPNKNLEGIDFDEWACHVKQQLIASLLRR